MTPGVLWAQTVSEITVQGNRRIEPETVISFLTVEPGGPITAEALNDSVRSLFDSGLFRDASITVEGNRLVVTVDENPTINRVAFEGNSVIGDEVLEPNVTSRPRRAFTRARAEADAQVLTEIYQRTGRFGATVEPVIIELPDNRVDLVFEIEEGSVTRINSITFVGNEVFSNRRLRRVIETSESNFFSPILTSDIYDPDRLELDQELLREFYRARGYADFTVLSAVAELSPDRRGFFITFTVDEGEQYTFGPQSVVSRTAGLDAAEFEELVLTVEGETYNADLVEDTIDRLIFLAGQKGFAFVRVEPRPIRDVENRTIGIVYELVEGPQVFVERIEIEGNTRTLDRVIRRQFDIVEGDAFNSRAVQQARRDIRGLGFFSNVEVETQRGSAEDQAEILVSVEEQPTGSLTFGAGFSTGEGILGEVSVSERNFLGRGQFVRARAVVSQRQQVADLTFREPAFLDRNLGVGFNAFYRLEDRDDESSFEETNFGFVPSVSFPVSESGSLSLRYNISSDEIREVRDTASPLIAADEGTAITSSVGYTYTFDRRDDPLEPTTGYLFRISQDFAGLGGDAQYVSTTALVGGFTSFLNEDVIVSSELEGGVIQGLDYDLRITDRFFLGGDSFRGFRRGGIGPRDLNTDDALGGNVYAVLRNQVSFPLGLPDELGIAGGLFADVGTLFRLDRTNAGGTEIDDDPKLRASVGASIFWDSAFGPLRVNFAVPVVEEEGDEDEIFRLTAGTRF
jgi:outer membrane protein insertion porin family